MGGPFQVAAETLEAHGVSTLSGKLVHGLNLVRAPEANDADRLTLQRVKLGKFSGCGDRTEVRYVVAAAVYGSEALFVQPPREQSSVCRQRLLQQASNSVQI